VGVLSLHPDRWSDWWEVRHDTIRRLARYFHVVWVEPQVFWRSVLCSRDRRGGTEREFPIPEGLAVHPAETWLPGFYRPEWLGRLTFSLRLARARRRLIEKGCTRIVLYVWRPEFYRTLDLVEHDLSCYHVEDEYTFSPVDLPIEYRERTLLERADQVFIHSPGLIEKKGDLNPNTLCAPNGVDFAAYSKPRPEPSDLAAIPSPRIGYTGRLKRQLDWHVIHTLAQRNPDWHFVFVGAVAPHEEVERAVAELSREPNLHFLGERSPWELSAYVQHFDVCVMPYVEDGYTRYIYPLKLHEFLASGQPIVASPIRTLAEFGHAIELAQGVEEWQAAIAGALSEEARSDLRVSERRDVARHYDWNVLVWKIARTIAGRLDPSYGSRIERARLELPAQSCRP
jgi:glycosyltransferase involved in cell wall biosynthesis